MKPGYCLDPLQPLLIGGEPDSLGLSYDLYSFVREVDNFGQKRDFEINLDELTAEMRLDGMGWYQIAIRAYRVKLFKAWEKQYSSFREYCEVALGRTVATINNWIRGARVVSELIACGQTQLPQSSSIAIELSKLDEGSLFDAWRDLCDRVPEHQINIEKLRNLMSDPLEQKPKTKRVQVEQDDWELLRQVAANAGLTPSQLLKQLIRGVEQPTEEETNEQPPKIDYFPEVDETPNTPDQPKKKREKPKGFGVEAIKPDFMANPELEVEIVDNLTTEQIVNLLDEMENVELSPSVIHLLDDSEDSEDDYIDIESPDTTDYEPPYIKKEEPPEADDYDYDPDDDYIDIEPPNVDDKNDYDSWNSSHSLSLPFDGAEGTRDFFDSEPLICEAKAARALGRIKDYFVSSLYKCWCVVLHSGHVLPLSEWAEVF